MEDRKYYHTDIESGETYEVSKESWEAIQKVWRDATPKAKDGKRIGKMIVFGTGGELPPNNDYFKELWKS